MNRPPRSDYPLLQRIGDTLALKLPDAGNKKNRRSERYEAIEKLHSEEEREEAKRLLYVAMTRAENKLRIWLHPKKPRPGTLQEILLDCLGESAEEWKKSSAAFPNAASPTLVAKDPKLLPVATLFPPAANRLDTSVSELETFSLCPLRHHFAYERRLPTAEADFSDALGATERGTLLHRALNLLQLRPQEEAEPILRTLLFEAGIVDIETEVKSLAPPFRE